MSFGTGIEVLEIGLWDMRKMYQKRWFVKYECGYILYEEMIAIKIHFNDIKV